jgi:hypothetical protein
MATTINALHMMNDPSVVMDVLNTTFGQNKKIEMLNYDNVSQLLPLALLLVNSKYETYINAGLSSALNILKHFSTQIIQLKTIAVGRGVDLAREERIKKCDACIDKFFEFSKSKGLQKALNRDGRVRECA